jgi:MSHA pilin protein MshC
MKKRRARDGGFTLIELVMVLVLTGILASYAVVRFPAQNELVLHSQTALLLTHLRHTQALAVHWAQPLRFTLSSGGYTVVCINSSTTSPCNNNPVLDPVTGLAFIVSVEAGISLSGATSIEFDSLGRPVSGGSLISTSSQITLTSGGVSRVVSISPVTGYAAS